MLDRFAEAARNTPVWHYRELTTGHEVMVTAPKEVTWIAPRIDVGRALATATKPEVGGTLGYFPSDRFSSQMKAKGKGHVSFPNRRLFWPALALQAPQQDCV